MIHYCSSTERSSIANDQSCIESSIYFIELVSIQFNSSSYLCVGALLGTGVGLTVGILVGVTVGLLEEGVAVGDVDGRP